jgi:hypothetical protein
LSEPEQLQIKDAEEINDILDRELNTPELKIQGLENIIHTDALSEENRGNLWAAIQARRVIEFDNLGNHHIVEPFALGITLLGNPDNEAVICYKIGGSEDVKLTGWRLYRIHLIHKLKIREERFTGERPDYDPDQIGMQKVFICVRLPKPEKKAPVIQAPPRIEPLVIPLSSPPPPLPVPTPKPIAPKPDTLSHNVLMYRFRMTHPAHTNALNELLLVPAQALNDSQKA